MRDLYHNVLQSQILSPVVSTTTKTSNAVDIAGFDSCMVHTLVGQCGDTLSGALLWVLKLTESDDNSTYTDVAVTDLLNGAATYTINSSSLDRAVYTFAYVGNKRYVKAVATPTGTHVNGTPIGMLALRGTAVARPVQ